MPKISNKKRKFIKKNFKQLSVEELTRQTGLKPNIIRSLINEYRIKMKRTEHSLSRKAIADNYSDKKGFVYVLRIVALVIFLLTLFVYTPALNNNFVNWDDNKYILENFHIRSLDAKSLYLILCGQLASFNMVKPCHRLCHLEV